jgi:periplasmic protein CpxP/Spy
MKKSLIGLAGLGALAGVLIVGQNTGQAPAGHAPRHGQFLNHMAANLNLTADQQAQAKQVMAGARQEAAPLRQQMKQNREALAAAIKSGNDAQIDQIAKAQAPVMAQLAAIRAHAFEKIYATLTPEQKAKADTMRQQFHAGRRG